LWLTEEPSAEKIISELEKFEIKEAVFCGFGEPLFALENIITTAKYLKNKGIKTRINTNGQASLICGEGVAKRLAGLIDVVSISLNASTPEGYNAVCKCAYGEEGFFSMLAFASECKEEGIRVILSVVDCIGKQEIEDCRKIAQEKGIEFRVREMID
jgi:TatD family-associated radical SAM protein